MRLATLGRIKRMTHCVQRVTGQLANQFAVYLCLLTRSAPCVNVGCIMSVHPSLTQTGGYYGYS